MYGRGNNQQLDGGPFRFRARRSFNRLVFDENKIPGIEYLVVCSRPLGDVRVQADPHTLENQLPEQHRGRDSRLRSDYDRGKSHRTRK